MNRNSFSFSKSNGGPSTKPWLQSESKVTMVQRNEKSRNNFPCFSELKYKDINVQNAPFSIPYLAQF